MVFNGWGWGDGGAGGGASHGGCDGINVSRRLLTSI
jgi:hypothetical protein